MKQYLLEYYDYEELVSALEAEGICSHEDWKIIWDECAVEDTQDTAYPVLVTFDEEWWHRLEGDPERRHILDVIWRRLDGDVAGHINILI
jgi:hypothetical protein